MEGYHNHDEFRVWMEMGLARTQFMAKKFADAEKWYDHVCRDHPNSWYHPEAMYWRAVCQYNQTHDAAPLGQVAQDLYREHPESIWAMKTMAWLPADHPANRATLL